MYGDLEHFTGILPHEKFPKHGDVERQVCSSGGLEVSVLAKRYVLEKRTFWSPLHHLSAFRESFYTKGTC